MIKNELILSICIPTYNRKNIVKNLVKELLKSKRTDFEIILVDNCSEDGTREELQKINDSRLSLYLNEERVSAIENGNKALKLAKGKYCMLFNDREIANYNYLDEILDFLKQDIYSFVYIYPSKNKKIKVFKEGMEAKKNISYLGYHPTGLTYNRKLLKNINLNEYIDYEKVNFYPNFFIVYDIVSYGKIALYPSKFWKLPNDQFKLKRKSGYTDLSKPAYITPENRIDRLYKFSDHIFLDEKIHGKERKRLLLKAFSQLYYTATCLYVYYSSQNIYECAHYGIEPRVLNFIDYLKISKKFIKDYIIYLEKKNYNIDLEIKLGIYRAILKSLVGVIKQKGKKNIRKIINKIRGNHNEKL